MTIPPRSIGHRRASAPGAGSAPPQASTL